MKDVHTWKTEFQVTGFDKQFYNKHKEENLKNMCQQFFSDRGGTIIASEFPVINMSSKEESRYVAGEANQGYKYPIIKWHSAELAKEFQKWVACRHCEGAAPGGVIYAFIEGQPALNPKDNWKQITINAERTILPGTPVHAGVGALLTVKEILEKNSSNYTKQASEGGAGKTEVGYEKISISKSELLLIAAKEDDRGSRRPVATAVIDVKAESLEKPRILIKIAKENWDDVKRLAKQEQDKDVAAKDDHEEEYLAFWFEERYKDQLVERKSYAKMLATGFVESWRFTLKEMMDDEQEFEQRILNSVMAKGQGNRAKRRSRSSNVRNDRDRDDDWDEQMEDAEDEARKKEEPKVKGKGKDGGKDKGGKVWKDPNAPPGPLVEEKGEGEDSDWDGWPPTKGKGGSVLREWGDWLPP